MMGGGASHVVFLDNTERDGEWLGERDVLKVERGFRVAVVVALDVLALPDRGRARKDDEGETVREFEFDRDGEMSLRAGRCTRRACLKQTLWGESFLIRWRVIASACGSACFQWEGARKVCGTARGGQA